jgi:hypothetical protein
MSELRRQTKFAADCSFRVRLRRARNLAANSSGSVVRSATVTIPGPIRGYSSSSGERRSATALSDIKRMGFVPTFDFVPGQTSFFRTSLNSVDSIASISLKLIRSPGFACACTANKNIENCLFQHTPSEAWTINGLSEMPISGSETSGQFPPLPGERNWPASSPAWQGSFLPSRRGAS